MGYELLKVFFFSFYRSVGSCRIILNVSRFCRFCIGGEELLLFFYPLNDGGIWEGDFRVFCHTLKIKTVKGRFDYLVF